MEFTKKEYKPGDTLDSIQVNLMQDAIKHVLENGVAPKKVSKINFMNFLTGSFVETVNGDTITHKVVFDQYNRPIKIDDLEIDWGNTVITGGDS